MYAVVGCNSCGMLWLLSDPKSAKTAQCPRCGKTHQTRKLKRFIETDDRNAAREARSALLAKKHGDSEAFAEVAHVSELEQQAETAGIDDEAYLEAVGLDADEVAAAGQKSGGGHSKPRDEIVREAVAAAGEEGRPTKAEIVDYAETQGVPPEKASQLLDKLRQRGAVSESGGRYRLL